MIPPGPTRRDDAGADAPGERTYLVEGMTCEHCERAVREEVEEVTGVESADVDRSTGRLTVRGPAVDHAAVLAAVEEAGYRVPSPSSPEPRPGPAGRPQADGPRR